MKSSKVNCIHNYVFNWYTPFFVQNVCLFFLNNRQITVFYLLTSIITIKGRANQKVFSQLTSFSVPLVTVSNLDVYSREREREGFISSSVVPTFHLIPTLKLVLFLIEFAPKKLARFSLKNN